MLRGLVITAVLVAFAANDATAQEPIQQEGYVRLSAPLNPVPRPNIPYQVGGTVITNQAFYAHEMLYPHRYRAVYPPYYYRVNYGPWGERWQLQGTEVKVDYSSEISPFALFFPTATR